MTTDVAEKPVELEQPAMGESPITVKTEDVDPRERIEWSDARIKLMKRKLSPPGTTDDEFAIFLEQCKRSQLDPLMGEADLVVRSSQKQTGQRGPDGYPIKAWVDERVFQPREQGLEARADRFEDFLGMRSAVVRKNDKRKDGNGPAIIDPAQGVVDHVIELNGDRGPIIGAWAVCHRRGRMIRVVWLPFGERDQGKAGWKSMPETMILKCAEMAALRKAYPNTFGGLYIEAEVAGPELELNASPADNRPTVAKVEERLERAAADQSAPRGAQPPPGQQTIEVKVERPAETKTEPAKPAETPSAPKLLTEPHSFNLGPDGRCDLCGQAAAGSLHAFIPFGLKKGATVGQLTGPELLESIALGTSKLPGLTDDAKSSRAVKVAKVQAAIDHMTAEMKRRDAAAMASVEQPAAREPGEDLD